jgi:hypothetical protein
MKLSRTFGVLLIAVVAVAVGLVVFQQLAIKPVNSFSPSTAVVEPAAPGYIGNSRIYLLSAKQYYGTYHETAVFIVNLTVRNDYTAQQPPPNPLGWNITDARAYFILLANLYDKNGVQINSHEYSSQAEPDNYFQVSLSSNKITSLTIYMVTSNRDVDHYTLVFGWLGATPAT